MNRIIFCILFSFIPAISFACSIPRAGPEYDALIAVDKTAQNTFEATISKKAGKLDYGVQVIVGYYPKGSEYRMAEYRKDIYAKEVGKNYIASFDLVKIEGHIPFVQVFWYPKAPGMCGAYGKSKDLVLE